MAKKNKAGWYSFVRWFPGEWYVETMAMDPVTLTVYMRLAACARNNDLRPGTHMTTLAIAGTTAGVTLKQVWQALCKLTGYVSGGAPLAKLEISEDGTSWTEIDRREAAKKEKENPDAFCQVRVTFAWIYREEAEAKKARAKDVERKRRVRENGGQKTEDGNGEERNPAESGGNDRKNMETDGKTRIPAKSKSKSKSKSKNSISTATSAVQEPLELKGDVSREPITWDKESQSIRGVSEEERARWSTAYPLVDVRAETERAGLWLKENPRRMKKDLVRFLGAWFRRAQGDAEERKRRTEDGGLRTDNTRYARGAADPGETGQKIEKNPSAGGLGQLLNV